MSLDNFLSFLQQLLTMTDPDNAASVALAQSALTAIGGLADASQKADDVTLRAMAAAKLQFHFLIKHREDFIGTPGDYRGNQIRRHRLSHVITPSC